MNAILPMSFIFQNNFKILDQWRILLQKDVKKWYVVKTCVKEMTKTSLPPFHGFAVIFRIEADRVENKG